MFDDMPAPTLRVYPRHTVVAEKLEAIISLGMANSRTTLNRRGTRKPSGVPIGLSAQFSSDRQKLTQWAAS
jgi:hypothetical protein